MDSTSSSARPGLKHSVLIVGRGVKRLHCRWSHKQSPIMCGQAKFHSNVPLESVILWKSFPIIFIVPHFAPCLLSRFVGKSFLQIPVLSGNCLRLKNSFIFPTIFYQSTQLVLTYLAQKGLKFDPKQR